MQNNIAIEICNALRKEIQKDPSVLSRNKKGFQLI